MKLRAAFMGSPDFAVPSLKAVWQQCELKMVVSQPDKPAGRGRQQKSPAVKLAAQALGIEVIQPAKVRDGSLAQTLKDLHLDIIVVAAYGRILPPEILSLPRFACINVHASLLPRWRGAAPIQRAVLAGDQHTGITLMHMDEGLDTGAMYSQEQVEIFPQETAGELTQRLAEIGGSYLSQFLQRFPNIPQAIPQDEQGASYAPILKKEEGLVNWSLSAVSINNHIRAMDPWPVAFSYRGSEVIKFYQGRVSSRERPKEASAGEVLGVDKDGLHVACGEGVVCICEVQPSGKRRMPAASYAHGRPFTPQEILASST